MLSVDQQSEGLSMVQGQRLRVECASPIDDFRPSIEDLARPFPRLSS